MIDVRANCYEILERIQIVAAKCGRNPSHIKLIAVTKTVPQESIRLAVACGITNIGENRFQEAMAKREALADLQLTWHFIGHLQTNKAKKVAEAFDWVQCVDRADLAAKLNQSAVKPLTVLIEVKLHDEPNKSGVDEKELPGLIEEFTKYDRLQLRGLMAVPPFVENPEDARLYFRRLRELSQRYALPELSMGMSHDFEIAIEEGATMVRIGTALFGQRR